MQAHHVGTLARFGHGLVFQRRDAIRPLALLEARGGDLLHQLLRLGGFGAQACHGQPSRATIQIATLTGQIGAHAIQHGTELEGLVHGVETRFGLGVLAGGHQRLALGGHILQLRRRQFRRLGVLGHGLVELVPSLQHDAHVVVRFSRGGGQFGGLGEALARQIHALHLEQDAAAQKRVAPVLGVAGDGPVDVLERHLELAGMERLQRLVVHHLRVGAVVAIVCIQAHLLGVRRGACGQGKRAQRDHASMHRHGCVSLGVDDSGAETGSVASAELVGAAAASFGTPCGKPSSMPFLRM